MPRKPTHPNGRPATGVCLCGRVFPQAPTGRLRETCREQCAALVDALSRLERALDGFVFVSPARAAGVRGDIVAAANRVRVPRRKPADRAQQTLPFAARAG